MVIAAGAVKPCLRLEGDAVSISALAVPDASESPRLSGPGHEPCSRWSHVPVRRPSRLRSTNDALLVLAFLQAACSFEGVMVNQPSVIRHNFPHFCDRTARVAIRQDQRVPYLIGLVWLGRLRRIQSSPDRFTEILRRFAIFSRASSCGWTCRIWAVPSSPWTSATVFSTQIRIVRSGRSARRRAASIAKSGFSSGNYRVCPKSSSIRPPGE